MGQQSYAAIVYGAILTGKQARTLRGKSGDDGLFYEWELLVRSKIQKTVTDKDGFWGKRQSQMEQEYMPHRAYESTDEWIGFIIAITDDNLADWWGKTAVLRNSAMPLMELSEMFPSQRKRACQRWDRFAKFCADHGTELKGQLLFVADFD